MPVQTTVDEARIDQFYQEIEQMVVTLGEDFTYQTFNRKNVQIRNFMDRIGVITSQLTGDLHRVGRQLLRTQKLYELERDNMLSTNMQVRAERTHAGQLAKVAHLLSAQLKEIHELEIQKVDLERMLGLVKTKLQDLHNAQSSLRDQRKTFELIHHNGKGLPLVNDSVKKLEGELDALLGDIAPTLSLPSPEGFLEAEQSEEEPKTLPDFQATLDTILHTIPSVDELKAKQRLT